MSSEGQFEGKGRKLGDAVKYYAIIEICMWIPTTWVLCYRFQPAIRFYSTPMGRELVLRGSTILEKYFPSAHASLAKLAGRVYGSPSGRTTAEWLLINKVISPVSFPFKMWLRHMWAERSKRAQLAQGEATPPEPAAK
mmetsp:Transcript_47296/g.117100  ORF Transcript_47296/g.117100 Transcript_47296/m.117100 type:complete len:138 (+) Transcript_47296:164-577(+)